MGIATRMSITIRSGSVGCSRASGRRSIPRKQRPKSGRKGTVGATQNPLRTTQGVESGSIQPEKKPGFSTASGGWSMANSSSSGRGFKNPGCQYTFSSPPKPPSPPPPPSHVAPIPPPPASKYTWRHLSSIAIPSESFRTKFAHHPSCSNDKPSGPPTTRKPKSRAIVRQREREDDGEGHD